MFRPRPHHRGSRGLLPAALGGDSSSHSGSMSALLGSANITHLPSSSLSFSNDYNNRHSSDIPTRGSAGCVRSQRRPKGATAQVNLIPFLCASVEHADYLAGTAMPHHQHHGHGWISAKTTPTFHCFRLARTNRGPDILKAILETGPQTR